MMTSNDPEDAEYTQVMESNSGSQELKFEDEILLSSVSVQNSNTSSARPQQRRRRRILISQSNYESNVDTFEEDFSKHRYAGSFRLKFGRDEFESGAHNNNADANQLLESQKLIMINDAKDTNVAESSFIESGSSSDMFVRPVDKLPQAVDQEQATVKVPKGSTTRKKQIRIFSSQEHNQSNAQSFEEGFSENKYAGSFRLRFRDEVALRRNTAQVKRTDATESETLVLHDDIDIQELPEPATPPCQQTITHDSEPEMEYENGSTNLMTAVMVDDGIIAVQENNMNGR